MKHFVLLLIIFTHKLFSNPFFVVVIPSYNNESICETNLTSVFRQTYQNYRVIYIDDCSSDKTYARAKELIEKHGMEKKVTLIHNEKRCLAMENFYHAIHSCDDREIIVVLDGDDWLYNEQTLEILSRYYSNPEIWLTYGSYLYYPENRRGECSNKLPDHVIRNNVIRDFAKLHCTTSHLRSFYSALFKSIKLDDLTWHKKFLPSSCDTAMMLPMVEMAGVHAVHVFETLYVNNRSNPINDDKVSSNLQRICKSHVLSLPRYAPLSNLFK